jgi:4-hydroxyphenylpyruvate dioxygenase
VRRSIATVSLSGTLEEKLRAAAAAGFDGVEIFENDLVSAPLAPEEVRELAAALGLSIDLYQPFRDFEAVPPVLLDRNRRRLRRKLDLMGRLGADTLLVCASCSPHAIDDDGLAAAHLHELAATAAERGVRVAYEPLAWSRHVSDYLHGWRLVESAGHPGLGVCLDSFHILTREVDPIGVEGIPGDRILFLQLADAPRLPMDLLQWSRHHRCFPGQGDLDVGRVVVHALAAGYAGPLSLEVFNDLYRQADPDRTAVDAMRSLLALEERVRRELGRRPGAGAVARLADPPAPARLRGCTFVELAAGGQAASSTEHLLRSLGFALAGRHRTKPVQLWRQGDVRLLLNAGDPRLAGGADAVLGSLAVESDDPVRSADRARALLSPVRARTHGPAEADMVEIAAPDGTSLFFCRTDATDPSSWIGDFVTLAPAEPPPGAGLTRIDHVALSQPFGRFDEAALFYRSVLGLEPADGQDLAAPDGLLRSRSLTTAAGEVRIALDAPLVGGAAHLAGSQHVAFACDDIVAVADALRRRGVPFLGVSGNYYDDLAARFDLPAGRVAAMRERMILYDRDERGGELFQLYTASVGGRLFFEIVQRTGGHTGLGAVNAPVRMAAQHPTAQHPTDEVAAR